MTWNCVQDGPTYLDQSDVILGGDRGSEGAVMPTTPVVVEVRATIAKLIVLLPSSIDIVSGPCIRVDLGAVSLLSTFNAEGPSSP